MDFPLNQSTGYIPILSMIPCNLSSERRHRIHGLLLQKPDFWCLRLGQPWRVQLVVHSSASVLWMHENNNDNNKTQPIAMNKYEKIVIIVITIATIITIRIIYNYSNSIYILYNIHTETHLLYLYWCAYLRTQTQSIHFPQAHPMCGRRNV